MHVVRLVGQVPLPLSHLADSRNYTLKLTLSLAQFSYFPLERDQNRNIQF